MTEEEFMKRARNISREGNTRLECGINRIIAQRANDNTKQGDWLYGLEMFLWFAITTLALVLITYNLFLR
jgi:hypothetical protein